MVKIVLTVHLNNYYVSFVLGYLAEVVQDYIFTGQWDNVKFFDQSKECYSQT